MINIKLMTPKTYLVILTELQSVHVKILSTVEFLVLHKKLPLIISVGSTLSGSQTEHLREKNILMETPIILNILHNLIQAPSFTQYILQYTYILLA